MLVVDCDVDGKVLENTTYQIDASLYWGDQKLNISDWSMEYNGATAGESSISRDLYEIHNVYTFNAGDTLRTSYITITMNGEDDDGGEHQVIKGIPVQPNKRGRDGAKGDSGAALVFLGDFSDNRGYTWDANIRHAVKYGGLYWLVNVAADDEMLGTPSESNPNWLAVTTLQITATDLLLAENASINLLSSNVINLFNTGGTKINADQNGSYCIYYPSGKKRIEFKYDGFIYYYNDDSTNSEQWRLGHGGDITKGATDDWVPFWLCELGQIPSGFDGTTTYERTQYYKFKASPNWAQYNGRVYRAVYDNPVPTQLNRKYVDDGLYTPNPMPYQVLTEQGTKWGVTVYQITSGEITNEYQITSE